MVMFTARATLAVTFAFISLIMATDGASPSSSTLGSSSILRDSSHSKRRTNADTLHESMRGAGNVVVRFYLIRHGQTDANIKGLVLGQTDSPLSTSGEQQARVLGRSDMITKQSFWRKYSSDLGRAQRTTNLILGEEDCLEDLDVELEPLLREVAKGVREMYPKKLSYEQAEARFRQDYGPEEPFPLLESEEQVMARVYRWMFQVVREAIEEYRLECQANEARRGGTRLYPVFAVSHSATLRVLITHLVRDELPKGIDFTPVGRDGAHSRSLDIPNTSVTVIDIIPHDVNDELWDAERTSQQVPADPSFLWTAKLKTLTYTTYNQNV